MDEHVWFNFEDLDYPHWLPVSQLEMQILWDGSHSLVNDHDRQAVLIMMDMTRQRLRRQARRGSVNAEWLSTAVMLTAMAGRLGLPLRPYRLDHT